ncbi:hydrolase [Corynebacterium suranareeae]|uniref:Hydrolase n=1 Tax=Corynebacterium suranareeae TaxID=2506452 RepID=A0A160PMY0_9CORY|nr:alpha/beta hydrolase [Corynebacterium suranareeae]BAU94686.1 hydrolase [Corynebacterium suranareeae]
MAFFSFSTSPLTRLITGSRAKTASSKRGLASTIASIERSPGIIALDGPFTHDHVSVRGIRLHLAEAGSPTDPLILLIHGAFGGWYDYRDVIDPLAQAGYHVAAIDLRGYGMSDKPPTGYDLRHAAGEINSVIAALGHDDALLVGSDTGASIAWATASMYPQRTRGLVSLGAIHPADMRRAIRRKPYLHLTDISRLTSFLHPLFQIKVTRAARREIVSNTSPSYQRSNAFIETVLLRKKALSIDRTTTPIIRTNRYLVGSVPNKTVSAPVWLLKTNTRRWEHLANIARSRATGAFTAIAIPGGFELPYLEHPGEFAKTIAEFARSAFKPQ